MGEALYDALLADEPGVACRVYAPVGGHRDLLAYLVRRLLENGANSSFVSVAADPDVPIDDDPEAAAAPGSATPAHARHPHIPLPRDLYGAVAAQFGRRRVRRSREPRGAARRGPRRRAEHGRSRAADRRHRARAHARDVRSPIDGAVIGRVSEGDDAIAAAAMAAAQRALRRGRRRRVDARAAALERAADLLEATARRLIALLQDEGGKTLDDALAEVREAADFCRYYAAEARRTLAPQPMPGPTGESNELHYRGRGVFVCISPWNFPLAIFLGQVAAALAAGNAVVAKPAEQTPLIAAEAVRLLHRRRRAGDARCISCRATARSAPRWSPMPRVAGVAFTGSTEVGASINRALAAQGRADRAADRRDRRHQRHDRRRDRAARAGHRRRGHLGVPLGRAALLGAAAAVRAGGRRRPHDRDDRGRRARAEARRSARSRDPRRPGDRRRGQGEARPLDRGHDGAGPRALPLRIATAAAGGRHLRARRPSSSSTARATCARRCSARCCTWCAGAPTQLDALLDDIAGERLRPDARHPLAHRRDRRRRSSRGSRTATSTSTAT